MAQKPSRRSRRGADRTDANSKSTASTGRRQRRSSSSDSSGARSARGSRGAKSTREAKPGRESGRSSASSRTGTLTGGKASARRSGKRSGRNEGEAGGGSVRERGSRNGGDDKGRKLKIGLAIGGGVLVLGLLLFWGSIRRSMLFKDLRSENPNVRASALRGLLEYSDLSRPGLVGALKNEPASPPWPDASRLDAAYGLVQLNNPQADDALTQAATSGDSAVRGWVMEAIVANEAADRFKADIFLKNAESPNAGTRRWVAQGLRHFDGPTARTTLLSLLVDDDGKVREAAEKSVLESFAAKDLQPVAELLASEEEPLQRAAKRILGNYGDAETVDILGAMLPQANERVSIDILGILARFPPMENMNGYLASTMKSPSIRVQIEAIKVASILGLKDTYDQIVAATEASSSDVRLAAVEALARIGKPGLAKKIHARLTDEDGRVRVAAIRFCGKMLDLDTTETMVKLIDHADKETSEAAMYALTEMYPLSGANYNTNAKRWKNWWDRFKVQKPFYDKVVKHAEEIKKLLDLQSNEGYVKILKIVDADMKEFEQFLSYRKLTLEFKSTKSPMRQRLESIQQKMKKWEYDAKKLQTLKR